MGTSIEGHLKSLTGGIKSTYVHGLGPLIVILNVMDVLQGDRSQVKECSYMRSRLRCLGCTGVSSRARTRNYY